MNIRVQPYIGRKQPIISGDTKAGNFKSGGQEWRPKGTPEQARAHDFLIPELGRAAPYGVYDLARNTGWVSSCSEISYPPNGELRSSSDSELFERLGTMRRI